MSLTLEELQLVINQSVKDSATKAAILKEAEEFEAQKKEEREANKSGAKSKYNYTLLIRVDDPVLKKVLENTEGFIAKTAESIDQATIIERITIGASRQNQNIKKKGKINTFADYFAFIKSKFHKQDDAGVKNVSKIPVRIIVLDKAEIDFVK